jgi:hypothetical protein
MRFSVYSLRIERGALYVAQHASRANEAEFTTEIMIHFSGLNNIDKPGVLLFPKALVCLDCGFSRFTILGTDVALLQRMKAGLPLWHLDLLAISPHTSF